MPIQGKRRVELTMDAILEKISEYDIFRYYMPTKDWDLNEVTFSPFREEKNPSFIIGNKRGYISFIDFANTGYRGDCFNFVRLLYKLSTLDDVLRLIDKDFKLGIATGQDVGDYKKIVGQYKQPEITKRNTIIQVSTRKFTLEELSYWNEYHQDISDLRRNNIYSIKTLYLNKRKFPLKESELRFGYFYDGFWKIYRPFAGKKEKWFPNNVPITALDGKENIKGCKKAFINKSKKDKMMIEKVFPCSIGVQNEGIACFSPENVEYIKSNSEEQILSFDSDVTGVQNSQQITQLFNFGYCNVPRKYLQEGIKDWALLGKIHGLKTVESVLKEKNII
jgi:DNA primase